MCKELIIANIQETLGRVRKVHHSVFDISRLPPPAFLINFEIIDEMFYYEKQAPTKNLTDRIKFEWRAIRTLPNSNQNHFKRPQNWWRDYSITLHVYEDF